jgi:heme A synthase
MNNIVPGDDSIFPRRKTYWDFMKEQPLVPIGMVTTTAVLVVGFYSMYLRDPKLSQRMMRARVAAQLFTVVAGVGYTYKKLREQPKELP